MTLLRSRDVSLRLARETREQFVTTTRALLAPTAAAIRYQLNGDAEQQITTARARQDHRDDFLTFRAVEADWVSRTQALWRNGVTPRGSSDASIRSPVVLSLQPLDDEVAESNVLASRLALSIHYAVSFEFNDLRLRVQALENQAELLNEDVLRPDALARLLVDQWLATGMSRALWTKVQGTLRKQLLSGLLVAYEDANALLIQHGVLPQIDLQRLARRMAAPLSGPVPVGAGSGGFSAYPSRTELAGRPLTAASQRAHRVFFDLRRFVIDRLGPEVSNFIFSAAVPRLLAARSDIRSRPYATSVADSPDFFAAMAAVAYGDGGSAGTRADGASAPLVQRNAVAPRRRNNETRPQSSNTADKATIEIVALMFEAILAEERTPFSVRVWFARLQMPVLRVALADPEFFGAPQHPARLLIDRMGSCIMGFEAAAMTGSALEAEIRRIVQVIEQYPESGPRVFTLVYEEFVAFLSKYLTKSDVIQRVMSVAQQVEQKETMAIQYTIELRKMLNDMPVREEIREFLFQVWAEVLALAALRYGAQDERTVALKRTASDLVWAVSAKPNPTERTRVIQDLPQLLQRLRYGLTLLGVIGDPQEAHIKVIGDTLADAFLSKTEAITSDQIQALAQRLTHIEDFVGVATSGIVPLDVAGIELLLGADAASLEVVPDTGTQVAPEMIAWANALQIGTWFRLEHNAQLTKVQFVWHSQRKQLHLFASEDGRNFLIQAGRLGSYLQAGLLVPIEMATLTVRATRQALAKREPHPKRWLN